MDKYDDRINNFWAFKSLVADNQKRLAFLAEKTEYGECVIKDIRCGDNPNADDVAVAYDDVQEAIKEIKAEKTNTGHVLTKEEKDLTTELIGYCERLATVAMNTLGNEELDEMMSAADAAIYPHPY